MEELQGCLRRWCFCEQAVSVSMFPYRPDCGGCSCKHVHGEKHRIRTINRVAVTTPYLVSCIEAVVLGLLAADPRLWRSCCFTREPLSANDV